jgi:multidrug efflux pump subunit AcrA (membrane-fusion protein)
MNDRGVALRLAPFVLALLLGACERHQEANAPEPVRPVLTAPVEIETTKLLGPFAGVVEPRYTTEVGFQTGGRIVARDVSVGDLVKKGERIAALDPTQQQFQLTSAEGRCLRASSTEQSGGGSDAQEVAACDRRLDPGPG